MTVKYCMRFQLITLIDITQTGARKGDDTFSQRQQQNYLTTIQTISLRANPTINTTPISEERTVKEFGSKYKGKQQIWKLNFSFEQQGSHSLDHLINDFDLVPIIKNLNETVDLLNAAFITNSVEYCNTVFLKLNDF